MISLKLTRLIEQHSTELTDELVRKLHSCSRTRNLQKLPAPELRNWIQETLSQFHIWLLTKGDPNGPSHYRQLARQYAQHDIPLADLCWAVGSIKEYLWDFVGQHAFPTAPLDLHAELELTRFVNVFFDALICYFAEGYEQFRSDSVEGQVHAGGATRMAAITRT